MIAEFKNKVTIERYGAPSQSATGGNVRGALSATIGPYFAKVETRNGSLNTGHGREWSYDYKITVRYYPTQVIQSGDFVVFEGNRLAVRSVEFENEGQRKLVILRCSRHE
jgi:hypothetical protein